MDFKYKYKKLLYIHNWKYIDEKGVFITYNKKYLKIGIVAAIFGLVIFFSSVE